MKKLIERPNIAENYISTSINKQFGELLNLLEQRELPDEIVKLINQEIKKINSISNADKNFMKTIKKTENSITKLVEKRLKIVPKKYYTKQWLILGMIIYGPPMGLFLGLILGNIGFLGIGFPLGMAIGLVIGSNMDKKALNEGRQLDIEIK